LRYRRCELYRRGGGDDRRDPLVKENIPYARTVLGISNISFGLPAAAREVVNSVFLYYCTKAGLDLAIVNSQKLERFAFHSCRGAEAGRGPAVQYATGRDPCAGRLAPAVAGAEGGDQPVPHRRHR